MNITSRNLLTIGYLFYRKMSFSFNVSIYKDLSLQQIIMKMLAFQILLLLYIVTS